MERNKKMMLNVIPYHVENQRVIMTFNTIQYQMTQNDIGVYIAASRVIAEWCKIKIYSQEEWENLRGAFDESTKAVMIHVTYFSYLESDNCIYVPVHLPLNGESISQAFTINEELLIGNYNRSLEHNYFEKALQNEALSYLVPILISNPDYATFYFPYYKPYAGFLEAWGSSIFSSSHEKWQHYCVTQNQLPSAEALQTLKGIVILGGKYSAYDEYDWLINLKVFLQQINIDYPYIKLVGICLGAQIIAETFGGKVEKISDTYIVKYESVYTTPEFREKFSNAREEYKVAENHGDNITSLPPNCEIWGYSDTSPIEIFGIQGKWLGFQGHPNYVGKYVEVFNLPYFKKIERVTLEEAETIISQQNSYQSHTVELLQCIKEFLRN
ncbi:unnamed protein product [Blepharisma stoltei]|uniref:Glutamine amidotransferase domain-containing protein n=1 Tax=Blepharisma stoltei TaxID=1481888 RepID=A0AAU9J2W1_9CILI|nr:unnamed protein product [Blepharisma stoltei]